MALTLPDLLPLPGDEPAMLAADAAAPPAGPASRLDACWAGVLTALERDPAISRASFATWLRGTRLVGREGARFRVAAQHTFAREKLERSFKEPIQRALRDVAGAGDVHLEFVVPGQQRGVPPPEAPSPIGAHVALHTAAESAPASGPQDLAHSSGPVRPASASGEPTTVSDGPGGSQLGGGEATSPLPLHGFVAPIGPDEIPRPELTSRYTFATFVAVPEAQFAAAAARAVAENPVLAYNPLYLYGASGLGKTHLLHAIGNQALALRPSLVVRYVSARTLLEVLHPDAPRGARAAALSGYASADLLLLDDVHEIAGQPCQRDVFHLVSALLSADKQLVVAAPAPPRALEPLDDRLRSHFQMGLVADLSAPGAESRLSILRAKVAARGATLPAGTLEQLARHVEGSVRELEGALTRVLAPAELSPGPRTGDAITAALASFTDVGGGARGRRVRPSAPNVLRAVSVTFGVAEEALVAKRRDKEVVLPRQAAMYLMRELIGASLSDVGVALGGRNHSTVLHGCEKVALLLGTDEGLRRHVDAARCLAQEFACAAITTGAAGGDRAGRAVAAAAAP